MCHRNFAQVAIWQNGLVSGRLDRDDAGGAAVVASSLAPTDEVALKQKTQCTVASRAQSERMHGTKRGRLSAHATARPRYRGRLREHHRPDGKRVSQEASAPLVAVGVDGVRGGWVAACRYADATRLDDADCWQTKLRLFGTSRRSRPSSTAAASKSRST